MFGRYKEHEDEPDWKEKLADWRDAPPVVLERPEWLTEGPGPLALLFVGLAAVLVVVAYLVVPPESLPAGTPGSFDVAKAEAVAAAAPKPVVTTTTTIPTLKLFKIRDQTFALNSEERAEFWKFVSAVAEFRNKEAQAVAIAAEPAQPPSRNWSLALIAGAAGIVSIGLAWYASEARSRRVFSN